MASIGRKGRKSEATAIESMLPKFELALMRTYLRMLAKVRLPPHPVGHHGRSIRRIMAAAARATLVAPSTESRRPRPDPGASLIRRP